MNPVDEFFRTILGGFYKLNNDEFEQLRAISQLKEFKKKEFLLSQGHYHKGLYFVVDGTIGLFEVTDGREDYLEFFLQGSFACDLESLSTQTTSKKNLMAMSDCSVLYIPRAKLLELYEVSPSYERLGRKMLEHLVASQHQFAAILKNLSPQEKYAFIEEKRPQLLQQVPLKYLASYLGLARETLSRIRKKM